MFQGYKDERHFRLRAEELRTMRDNTRDQFSWDVLDRTAKDYDRLACLAAEARSFSYTMERRQIQAYRNNQKFIPEDKNLR